MTPPQHQSERLFASATAHALNNITATLYAGLDSLEAARSNNQYSRLLAILQAACGKSQALSAANLLFASTFAAAESSDKSFVLDSGVQESLYEAVVEVAQVTINTTWPSSAPTSLSMDIGKLKAVWVCAAALLRRSLKPDEPLSAEIKLVQKDNLTCVLELGLHGSAALPAQSEWLDDAHPCGMALIHTLASPWAGGLQINQTQTSLVICAAAHRSHEATPALPN